MDRGRQRERGRDDVRASGVSLQPVDSAASSHTVLSSFTLCRRRRSAPAAPSSAERRRRPRAFYVPPPDEGPKVPDGFHADLQRQGPDRLAHQQDEPSRHDARLRGAARRDRRHAESARQGRHPAHRQEVQERRGLHRGQAGLGLRQRPVPALERGRRSLPGHARLPAGRRHGRHLRRASEGRDQRQGARRRRT